MVLRYLLSSLLLFSISVLNINAQSIGPIKIQYSNPVFSNTLEVIAEVTMTSGGGVKVGISSTRVSQDTIYITTCYAHGPQAQVIVIVDTIQIGPLNPGSYKLAFKASASYNPSNPSICNPISSAIKYQPFTISGPTGIKGESTVPKIVTFPNPATEFLHINNHSIKSITIRDLSGKTIKQETLQGKTHSRFDISSLKTGLYLVEVIYSDGKRQIQKLLKT